MLRLTERTLRAASRRLENAEAVIWKLLLVAQKSWRALNAPCLMRDVYDGKR